MTATHYRGRMTRTYAARKLLEHGPLTQPELLEITGWKPIEVSLVTQRLMQCGDVAPVNLNGMRHYALASSSTAHGWPHGTERMQLRPSTTTQTACRGWN